MFVVAVLALLAGTLGVGLGWRALADSNGAAGTASASGTPQTVAIELGDLFVRPSSIDIPAGTDLTLEVTNTGAMPHDLKLGGDTDRSSGVRRHFRAAGGASPLVRALRAAVRA